MVNANRNDDDDDAHADAAAAADDDDLYLIRNKNIPMKRRVFFEDIAFEKIIQISCSLVIKYLAIHQPRLLAGTHQNLRINFNRNVGTDRPCDKTVD